MKIRCGSHQQNRSIVRPGLSLMAAKVALTAEEFRENSQRSIALFNTEKLSTDSTHVLKSAYCNSVHFCRCNLHGACGGKGISHHQRISSHQVAICTGRVEAKIGGKSGLAISTVLQSARGVWRQRMRRNLHHLTSRCCNLHGACGGKGLLEESYQRENQVAICTGRVEAKASSSRRLLWRDVAICTGRVEAKLPGFLVRHDFLSCNLHGACGGKGKTQPLQSHLAIVAICTGRVEAKQLNEICRIFRVRCNLHGACGGKVSPRLLSDCVSALQSARGVWRQRLIPRS